ncbi:MAG TPA: hypothetical protein VEH58_01500 [Dehalococcoidales bacterium]|nr:hypothetical protein [Dehalococcoidales bacterium]
MKIQGLWMGILAIVVGILVLVWPDLIRWFVGVGLIVLGVVAIIPSVTKMEKKPAEAEKKEPPK